MATTTSTRKAPAKRTAPATAPATPAATTAAPAAATKAPATPAAPKLRWVVEGERDSKGRAPCAAGPYTIGGTGDSWMATVKRGTKTVVLAEGSFAKCYASCTADNRAQAK